MLFKSIVSLSFAVGTLVSIGALLYKKFESDNSNNSNDSIDDDKKESNDELSMESSQKELPLKETPLDQPLAINTSLVQQEESKPTSRELIEKDQPVTYSIVPEPLLIDISASDATNIQLPLAEKVESELLEKEQSLIKLPVVKSPVEAPVAKSPLEAPVAKSPVEAPVAKSPVEAPVAKSPVEAPVAKSPLEAPVVKSPVEAPVVKSPEKEEQIKIQHVSESPVIELPVAESSSITVEKVESESLSNEPLEKDQYIIELPVVETPQQKVQTLIRTQTSESPIIGLILIEPTSVEAVKPNQSISVKPSSIEHILSKPKVPTTQDHPTSIEPKNKKLSDKHLKRLQLAQERRDVRNGNAIYVPKQTASNNNNSNNNSNNGISNINNNYSNNNSNNSPNNSSMSNSNNYNSNNNNYNSNNSNCNNGNRKNSNNNNKPKKEMSDAQKRHLQKKFEIQELKAGRMVYTPKKQ